ncbi:hypothetical protein JVT61DRAFT_9140 [Boletus reticuloceps]|uniref:Uncharacterized protein n=1 Tax=Boletus reticuloceps TaxID=495285 RepID=A0A8I2YH16_9AGAM|nr:hypothetical protein JVT61DRAFT_9140 [Boletus reticuloceps]
MLLSDKDRINPRSIQLQSLSRRFTDLGAAVNKAGHAVRQAKDAVAVAEISPSDSQQLMEELAVELEVAASDTGGPITAPDNLMVDVIHPSVAVQVSIPASPRQIRNDPSNPQPARPSRCVLIPEAESSQLPSSTSPASVEWYVELLDDIIGGVPTVFLIVGMYWHLYDKDVIPTVF